MFNQAAVWNVVNCGGVGAGVSREPYRTAPYREAGLINAILYTTLLLFWCRTLSCHVLTTHSLKQTELQTLLYFSDLSLLQTELNFQGNSVTNSFTTATGREIKENYWT